MFDNAESAIPGNPDGVEVSPMDGKIHVNTVSPVAGAPDPANGGIYALDDVDGTLLEPFDRDLGALDGLDFTDGGTMLNTQIKGGVDVAIAVNCPDRSATSLTVDAELTSPADIALRKMDSGEHLLIVPALFARDATAAIGGRVGYLHAIPRLCTRTIEKYGTEAGSTASSGMTRSFASVACSM